MESLLASTAAMPLEDRPTAASLPAMSPMRPARSQEIDLSTDDLLYYAVNAYFCDQQHMPRLVAMHPLRLLTLPSSRWPACEVRDLGMVALRALTLIECQQMDNAVDVMVCE